MIIISNVTLAEGREIYKRRLKGENVRLPPPTIIDDDGEGEFLDKFAAMLAKMYDADKRKEVNRE